MKKINKKMIIIQGLVVAFILLAVGFYVLSTKNSSDVSQTETDSRIEVLNYIYNEKREIDDLEEVAYANSYSIYEPSTFMNKYSFVKVSKETIENKYDKVENPIETYYFSKDYDQNLNNSTNFITKINNDETEFIISIYNNHEYTLLIEEKIYVDCSIDECNTEELELEIYYNQYLYNVEKNTLSKFNSADENELELEDIVENLNLYFSELKAFYAMN
ncbi:MAG: hypothetical protein ACK5K7_06285 [Bacilli bacterium]